MDRTKATASLRRLRAAYALGGYSFDELARRCDVSGAHLRFVLLGERAASARLLGALARELGDAWPFVCGRTDALVVADEDGAP